MDDMTLRQLGVAPLAGSDVFGGDTIPLAGIGKLGWIVVGAMVVAVVANWEDFKDGCFEGYNEATH